MPALRQRFTRLTATSRFLRRLPALALITGALLVPSTALAASRLKVSATAPSHNLIANKTLHVTVKATYGGRAATGKAYYRFYITDLGYFGPKAAATTQKLKNGKTVFSIKPTKQEATSAVDEGGAEHLKFALKITAKTSHGTVTTTFPVTFKLK